MVNILSNGLKRLNPLLLINIKNGLVDHVIFPAIVESTTIIHRRVPKIPRNAPLSLHRNTAHQSGPTKCRGISFVPTTPTRFPKTHMTNPGQLWIQPQLPRGKTTFDLFLIIIAVADVVGRLLSSTSNSLPWSLDTVSAGSMCVTIVGLGPPRAWNWPGMSLVGGTGLTPKGSVFYFPSLIWEFWRMEWRLVGKLPT